MAEQKEKKNANEQSTPASTVTQVQTTRAADHNAAQHAENLAYTVNHALACTATDFIDPYVGKMTQKYLNQKVTLGCGEDHEHGTTWQGIVGELAGDFGAVPLTVAIQNYAPWFMDAVRYVSEPVMGDLFRSGAKAAATEQAKLAMMNNTPFTKEEYQTRARELYRYEIQHLPQGLVWTTSAVVGNVMIQKHVLKNPSDIGHIYAGKINGAILSSSFLFGGRVFFTDKAKHWDEFATRHVFLPASKAVGKWFGVKEADVDALLEKQEKMNDPNWRGKVTSPVAEKSAALGA